MALATLPSTTSYFSPTLTSFITSDSFPSLASVSSFKFNSSSVVVSISSTFSFENSVSDLFSVLSILSITSSFTSSVISSIITSLLSFPSSTVCPLKSFINSVAAVVNDGSKSITHSVSDKIDFTLFFI